MAKQQRALTREAIQNYLKEGDAGSGGDGGKKPDKKSKRVKKGGGAAKRVTMVTRIGNTLIDGLRNELTSSSAATRAKGFAVGAVIALACLFLMSYAPMTEDVDNLLNDAKMQLRGDTIPAAPNLLHLDIDDKSLDAVGRWPWPRRHWEGVILAAKDAGVDKLVFDVEFSKPQPPETDEAALKNLDFWKDQVLRRKLEDTNAFTIDQIDNVHAKLADISARIADNQQKLAEATTPEASEALTQELDSLRYDLESIMRYEVEGLSQSLRVNDATESVASEFDRLVAEVSINHDELFARAIKQAGNVYLPISFSSGANEFVLPSRAVEWDQELVGRVFAYFDQIRDLDTIKPMHVEEALKPYLEPTEEESAEELARKASEQSLDVLRRLYVHVMVHDWYADKSEEEIREHMKAYLDDWYYAASVLRTAKGEVFERLAGKVGDRTSRWGGVAVDELQKYYTWHLILHGKEGKAPWSYPLSVIEGYDPESYDFWAQRERTSGFLENNLHHYRDIELEAPIFRLAAGAAGLGLVIIEPDGDGKLRRVPLFVVYADGPQGERCLLPHIAFQVLLEDVRAKRDSLKVVLGEYVEFEADSRIVEGMQGDEGKIVAGSLEPLADDSEDWKTYRIFVDDECNVRLNWYGESEKTYPEVFNHLPVAVLVDAASARQSMIEFDESWERSKDVLIGKLLRLSYVDGGNDRFLTQALRMPFAETIRSLALIGAMQDADLTAMQRWLYEAGKDFFDDGYDVDKKVGLFRDELLRTLGFDGEASNEADLQKFLDAKAITPENFAGVFESAALNFAKPLTPFMHKRVLDRSLKTVSAEHKKRYFVLSIEAASRFFDVEANLDEIWEDLSALAQEMFGSRPEAFTDEMKEPNYAYTKGLLGNLFGEEGDALRDLLANPDYVTTNDDIVALRDGNVSARESVLETLRWEVERLVAAGLLKKDDPAATGSDEELIAFEFAPASEFRKYRTTYVLLGDARDAAERDYHATLDLARDRLEGSFALVGAAATALGDLVASPIYESIPGPSVHTNTYNTVLQKVEPIEAPWLSKLIGGVLALLVCVCAARFNVKWGVLSFIAILGTFFAIDVATFKVSNSILESTNIYAALCFPFVAIQIYRYGVEYRAKNMIKKQFGKFLDPEAVEALQKSPPTLGGDEAELAVYFSDIAGFTPISESMPAPRLIDFLNDYMGRMTEAIKDSSGYVDKFIGDAVMAVWGAPRPVSDYSERACKAAVRNCQKLREWNRERVERGELPVGTRVGVATGPMVAGNMGTEWKMNYTVIGDTVNLSARLEAANKQYGTQIMINDKTYEQAKNIIVAHKMDNIAVKGKKKGVPVYHLIGLVGEVDPDVVKGCQLYTEAFDLYQEEKWEEALELFKQAKPLLPPAYDVPLSPSDHMISRCEHLVGCSPEERMKILNLESPDAEWDGVWRLTSK